MVTSSVNFYILLFFCHPYAQSAVQRSSKVPEIVTAELGIAANDLGGGGEWTGGPSTEDGEGTNNPSEDPVRLLFFSTQAW
jgi:hypothetical protein